VPIEFVIGMDLVYQQSVNLDSGFQRFLGFWEPETWKPWKSPNKDYFTLIPVQFPENETWIYKFPGFPVFVGLLGSETKNAGLLMLQWPQACCLHPSSKYLITYIRDECSSSVEQLYVTFSRRIAGK